MAGEYEYILFPGRHHLLTDFQLAYLRSALIGNLIGKPEVAADAKVIFVITSADHENTRRNPIAGHRRESMIEHVCSEHGIDQLTYLVDDLPYTDRFADHILQTILRADGPELSSDNTILACSTPGVAALFDFELLPVEADRDLPDNLRTASEPVRPWDLIMQLVESDGSETTGIDQYCLDYWGKYKLSRQLQRAYADPAVSSEGELTDTRDYETYGADFDAAAERKYKLLKPWIHPGRIVDVGCGTGSLLRQLSKDPNLAESDLYGLEIARPLYQQCLYRKRSGAFDNPNTFFYQRNLLAGELFAPQSIDTTITAALTHELWSYAGEAELRRALQLIYQQTALGGVYINSDVCGPRDGDQKVWIKLKEELPEMMPEPLEHPDRLPDGYSSSASFIQFIADWRSDAVGPPPTYQIIDGHVQTDLRTAMEWLEHKDYGHNWASEMHESFCFWDQDDWRRELEAVGFELHPASEAYTNQWLAEQRFDPIASLHPPGDPGKKLPWPDTHALMICIRN